MPDLQIPKTPVIAANQLYLLVSLPPRPSDALEVKCAPCTLGRLVDVLLVAKRGETTHGKEITLFGSTLIQDAGLAWKPRRVDSVVGLVHPPEPTIESERLEWVSNNQKRCGNTVLLY